MKVAVIIPTYNERANIKKLVKQIFALNISELEVIVVDDSSNDGTLEVVRALRKRFPVTLILRPKKLGLGSALRDGLTLAVQHGATVTITMDADFSHDPQLLPKMISEIVQGKDLVIGSRRISGGEIIGWGPWRTFMSRAAMEFSRRVLDISARDVTSGFRAYRRRVLEIIDLSRISSTGYAFQEEMLYKAQRAGFKIAEIPIVFNDRRHGKSKLGIRDIAEFFVTVVRLKLS
ncbi:hypothetical protein A3B21_05000 [Candidatus Uhrbacteria bacterium RIFCSPLOWO2_01_FULL_47_24]|uniref:Glycosyltransferase 2-like domain-containing protein n=1 Tax=Candidatus Uhrbacteria bacterium RIFCSPLOWO2_01_FULL_47_24 TaxID=1802401 RepID=A0A1F7UWD4_9BACT|nr:MAG: hypothetical protein A2753_03035 [Candidatus Uhrbacteria bacterium RIFCSPHIGHO2_01_FULL_47_11]OGL69309.1 MAG: hypothetical protein A3D58_03390 [Candidatus Uhrbacteria bacterium RIFCSPHIGHO2_02_FULL_46_47]OGL76379.1 MAG: hypothetical protein A3F52_00680 [Candidatus Uhrbacteria bacterium RIFCSPHIGHO2_12_FULL_47_11]OGL82044.1 MAG: hypothetical protein A3B21_05000 [Candidatus Uhrbacteria bacterium RIFCSPLOWO2_01_FULL_47_24]OGL85438.1 MAG: hypothetical protein A3J03_05165 [Candidatus Uhrbact